MFNIFKIGKLVRLGRTAEKVAEAIKAERRGEIRFLEMSKEIGEAFVDEFANEGVNVVDDAFGAVIESEGYTAFPLHKLRISQSQEPSIGKQVRIDLLKRKF